MRQWLKKFLLKKERHVSGGTAHRGNYLVCVGQILIQHVSLMNIVRPWKLLNVPGQHKHKFNFLNARLASTGLAVVKIMVLTDYDKKSQIVKTSISTLISWFENVELASNWCWSEGFRYLRYSLGTQTIARNRGYSLGQNILVPICTLSYSSSHVTHILLSNALPWHKKSLLNDEEEYNVWLYMSHSWCHDKDVWQLSAKYACRDHSGYKLDQWEKALHYASSNWLGPYLEWFLTWQFITKAVWLVDNNVTC